MEKPQSFGKVDHDYWYGRKRLVDLAIASRAFNVATADYWLQDKLDPNLRRRLRSYIKRDVINPYLKELNSPGKEARSVITEKYFNMPKDAIKYNLTSAYAVNTLKNLRDRLRMREGIDQRSSLPIKFLIVNQKLLKRPSSLRHSIRLLMATCPADGD
jgi:hypothetical protein